MIPTRRFGRTELPMPVLSLGGMRFQQSWSDLAADAIEAGEPAQFGGHLGCCRGGRFSPCETARYYGTSELQLGPALAGIPILSASCKPRFRRKMTPLPLKPSWSAASACSPWSGLSCWLFMG